MKTLLKCLIPMGATFLVATATHASTLYYVSNTVYANNNGNVDTGIGYNAQNTIELGHPLSSYVGYGQYNSSCNGCSISGPTDTTGLLTAAIDSAAFSGQVCAGFNPVCLPSTSQGLGIANLATGSVGVKATGNTAILQGINQGGSAIANSDDADQLTFTIGGANANTVTQIGVTYAVSGSISNVGDLEGFGTLDAVLNFGSANATFVTNASTSNTSFGDNAGGWVSYSFTGAQAAGGFVFNGVYQLTGANISLPISFGLQCEAGNGATCDYSHTGIVSLSLPGNVSYTSASGVFLTGQQTATPEPASWGIAGLGIAMVWVMARRRRSRKFGI